ncbi:CopG family transcriptional regulator [Breoghania sp. L-A4]|nr:CopG family transcriptional regulator [Breoghania sp. L-A4]
MFVTGAFAAGLMAAPAAHAEGVKPPMTVIKSPWCGCCTAWVEIAETAGYTVKIVHREDFVPLKRQHGVPDDLAACHTVLVDQYVVEGHVPLEAVDRLLSERPEIRGIAVAGMPAGSPGMGDHGDAYDVVTFQPGTVEGSTVWMSVPAH